jgi:hypothetical protein
MMDTVTALPTMTGLRRALESLDTAVLSRAVGHDATPLGELTLLVAAAAPGDRASRQTLLTALVAGLRSLGGDGWRDLAGQPALDLVRQALDAAGRMQR